MQRMRSIIGKLARVMVVLIVTGVWWPARGDLIRPKASPTYPDIAGDLVGSQTYTYDPTTKTGTFQVTNSPQLFVLGPPGDDMAKVLTQPGGDAQPDPPADAQPERQARARNPDNRFQLYGTWSSATRSTGAAPGGNTHSLRGPERDPQMH